MSNSRVTQEALEAAAAGSRLRVTQVGAEVVAIAAPPPDALRVTQVGAEAVYPVVPPADRLRLTQLGAEVMYLPLPSHTALVTQATLEVASLQPTARLTQGLIEVAFPEPPIPANPLSHCWDERAAKLLEYLAAPFKTDLSGRLGTLFRAIARELSGCRELVTFDPTPDARAAPGGVAVRFDPVTAVYRVQQVDAFGALLVDYATGPPAGRAIPVLGTPPVAGDRLSVAYTYQHEGLEVRLTEALAQLNLWTAVGEFLDRWGAWFAVPRLLGEGDGLYARRIMATVTASRNTRTAILTAVQALAGSSAYMVEWFDALGGAWIWKATGDPVWRGGDAARHLVWGATSRFTATDLSLAPCTFAVYFDCTAGVSKAQVQAVIDRLKAAGTQGFARCLVSDVPVHLTQTVLEAASTPLSSGGRLTQLLIESASRTTLTSGLVSAYTFEASGSMGADSSGNGHTLALTGSVPQGAGNAAPGAVAGTYSDGGGFSPVGTLSGSVNTIAPGSDYTTTCWVRPLTGTWNTTPYDMFVMGSMNPGINQVGLYLQQSSQQFYFLVSGGGAGGVTVLDGQAPATLGSWHFLHCQWDHTNNLLGIRRNNGPLVTVTGPGTAYGLPGPWAIGADGLGAGHALDGRVDAVNVWNRLLTPAEVTDLYNAGAGREYPF